MKHIPTFMLAAALCAACTQNALTEADGISLPKGQYPVACSASVETAATSADGYWTGTEQVAVQAAFGTSGWAEAEVKTYIAGTDGKLAPADADNTFWWESTAEQMMLRAWYCGDGSSAAGGANASSVPSSWSVLADQSGNGADGEDAFQASDLLFASPVAVSFSEGTAVPLVFRHQTARVIVNIVKGEYVTGAGQIQSVTVGDGNLVLECGFTPPSGDAGFGTWTTDAAEAGGTVIPRRMDAVSDAEKYVAGYEALVIPQSTAGKRMVAVTTSAGTLYYTAPEGAGDLVAGKVRTYDITVRPDRLEVAETEGGEWADGGSETVIGWPRSYTADDLKFGDYYYSDGTTSDGGFRVHHADGTQEWESEKPLPVPGPGKEVIGIVVQTDVSRIGEAEREALAARGVNEPHGLVMSVKDVYGKSWATYPFIPTTAILPRLGTLRECYNDISGLRNTRMILDSPDYNGQYHPAFEAISDFGESNPAPENTTGWFIPSAGQAWDMVALLTRATIMSENDFRSMMDAVISPSKTWTGQGSVNVNMSYCVENIDGADLFDRYNIFLWTSSQSDLFLAVIWYICNSSYGQVSCRSNNMNSTNISLRPVLAF